MLVVRALDSPFFAVGTQGIGCYWNILDNNVLVLRAAGMSVLVSRIPEKSFFFTFCMLYEPRLFSSCCLLLFSLFPFVCLLTVSR